MQVVIAGGSGLIGTHLSSLLQDAGHTTTVLSRTQQARGKENYVKWKGTDSKEIAECISGADAIVNLAGANIGEKRWNLSRKNLIRSSRAQAGKTLAEAVRASNNPPKVFIQASAVGYYGNLCGPERISENLPPGNDFLASVCVDWESSTESLAKDAVRLVTTRFGIVLSKEGGALPRMLTPFRLGVGGPLGSGKQPFPWIHLHDAAKAIVFALDCGEMVGTYNLTSPSIANNAEFSRALAKVLHRPLLPAVPSFVVRRMFGEMADILLCGQNATSAKLQSTGFCFSYPEMDLALADLLS